MQRAIWIVTFFVILAVSYYWLFVDQERLNKMELLTKSDETITDNINTVSELERRLELRYIGHGKHLQDIQDEFRAHYKSYIEKMDSIDLVFEEIKFTMQQMEDNLVKKIDRTNDAVENLSDNFESFKRKTNRTTREIQLDISTIKDDINKIMERLPEEKKKK
ncbi:MAG: hypothetical protein CMF80_07250 [Candidatus Marinimicrobia bacterium]|jgi:DNA anti-recombination protein RmuC|nr:hypothetical protein [Candidatus Neomarinimicrobiota bacterium]|tara:strand:+ start:161 stop:649 length:489 start_codon:yes stop_codon:yes gene_type:complete